MTFQEWPDSLEDRFREEPMHNEVALTPRTKILWEQREQRIKDQVFAESVWWSARNKNVVELKRYRRKKANVG